MTLNNVILWARYETKTVFSGTGNLSKGTSWLHFNINHYITGKKIIVFTCGLYETVLKIQLNYNQKMKLISILRSQFSK